LICSVWSTIPQTIPQVELDVFRCRIQKSREGNIDERIRRKGDFLSYSIDEKSNLSFIFGEANSNQLKNIFISLGVEGNIRVVIYEKWKFFGYIWIISLFASFKPCESALSCTK
jgi:hypothetical protein